MHEPISLSHVLIYKLEAQIKSSNKGMYMYTSHIKEARYIK